MGWILINVCGPKDPRRLDAINTTSKANGWSRGLSPFVIGPVPIYGGQVSQNMENAWQYSKVYEHNVGPDGNPTAEYFAWAKEGWDNPRGIRYPMGKGAIPKYSYWDGEKLSYIEARKKIYVPLYADAVASTHAFAQLKTLADQGDVWLWDYDGYDYRSLGMTLDDVLNCETRKMGHAFVLARMLEGLI